MNRKRRRREAKAAKSTIAGAAAQGQPRKPTHDTVSLMQTAVAHHRSGRLPEAATLYQRILVAQPDFTDAQHLLGVVALQSGHLVDAERQIRRAIELQPHDGEYWNNLGVALKKMGRFREALSAYREAVEWAPQMPDYWMNFANCCRATTIDVFDRHLFDTVLACFSREDVDHRALTGVATSLLRLREQTSSLFDEETLSRSLETWSRSGKVPSWIGDPLLNAFLRHAIVGHADFEFALIRVRAWLLDLANNLTASSKVGSSLQAFSVALALQCFFNEYVFLVAPGELAVVDILKDQIQRAEPVTAAEELRLAVYASYAPLHGLANASDLQPPNATASKLMGELLRRQIAEPLLENQLRGEIAVIGGLEDAISGAVRNQYEQNPYPRWRAFSRPSRQHLHDSLTGLFPHLVDIGSVECPDVLVAGCGTGLHALMCAQAYAGAKVLAIDLSLSSLSYAVRMAALTGSSNLEFAQADILDLATLGRQFDLVECVGVLHHLAEPVTGWRVLTGLLKSRGLMKIGLYSELARQPHIAAQKFVDEHNYEATPDGIRSARRDIFALSSDHPAHRITGRINFTGYPLRSRIPYIWFPRLR